MKHTTIFAIAATMLLQLAVATNLFASYSTDSIAQQKSYFYSAKQELNDMLSGKIPLDYERAIFIIENAHWGNKNDYLLFQSAIDFHTANIIKLITENRDYSSQNFKPTLLETEEIKKSKYEKALANWAIFSYISDTTFFIQNNKVFYHLPFNYTTDDPLGTLNWKNTQVISLLNNNIKKANCFALASFFKIFSERLNSEANICTAPGHIYIRHADHKGIFHNVELASRAFPGTGSMEVLTYTTDDATKNGISLRELDFKKSIALCLVYLAKGYEYKFGIKDDNFILQCSELALQYDSLNLNAMLLKSEVLEERIIKKNKTIAQLQSDKDFVKYEKLIAHLYKLGYREMPLEMKNIIIASLKKDTVPIIAQNHTPQPFKDLGVKDTKYATLSWGLFDEMHEEKPFEQYNRTEFNTKKKKISKFVKPDILYNQYNFDPVVFAWSIDPLAHKYPFLSPYVAFGNNPILFIDNDGKEIKINGSNDFKQQMLTQLQLLTKDKLILDAQGVVKIQNPSADQSTQKVFGTSLVTQLVSTSNTVNVNQAFGSSAGEGKNKTVPKNGNSDVFINVDDIVKLTEVTGEKKEAPLQIILGHELIHASDIDKGVTGLSKPSGAFDPDNPGVIKELSVGEFETRKNENILRKEQGITPRAIPSTNPGAVLLEPAEIIDEKPKK